MKKRNKILSIVTSVFGAFALCGLSIFSLYKKEKVSENVSAVSINTVYSTQVSDRAYATSDNSTSFWFYYDFTLNYNRYFDDSITYGFNVALNYYLTFTYNSQTCYVRPAIDSSSTFGVVFESNRVSEPIASGSSIGLRLSSLDLFYGGALNPYTTGVAWFDLLAGGSVVGYYRSNVLMRYYGVDSSGNSLTYNVSALKKVSYPLSFASFSMTYTLSDYDNGFQDGYDSGYSDGYNAGSNQGYQDGYNTGKYDAEQEAQQAITNSYNNGYSAGYEAGLEADGTAMTIMSGIFQVALVPINFFLGMFNFNILGINLASVIQAFFTIAVTIILIKTIAGKKGD